MEMNVWLNCTVCRWEGVGWLRDARGDREQCGGSPGQAEEEVPQPVHPQDQQHRAGALRAAERDARVTGENRASAQLKVKQAQTALCSRSEKLTFLVAFSGLRVSSDSVKDPPPCFQSSVAPPVSLNQFGFDTGRLKCATTVVRVFETGCSRRIKAHESGSVNLVHFTSFMLINGDV